VYVCSATASTYDNFTQPLFRHLAKQFSPARHPGDDVKQQKIVVRLYLEFVCMSD